MDIRRHEFVPKHILLNDREKEGFLKKMKIELKQLPRILENDPVIKLLGGKPGDIVKIMRKSETAGESLYYRIVIKG